MDYLSGRFEAIHLGPGREPDQNCDLAATLAAPGSLQLFDMGYSTLKRLPQITARGAYFLTRLKTNTHVYLSPTDPQPLDLARWLETQASTTEGIVNAWVYLGAKERVPVRLVAQRLPKQTVEERQRKARQNAHKKQRQVTQPHLTLLAWAICITTVPSQMLSAQEVMQVYRLRWQIELLFKLAKSQFRLDFIGPWRRERVLCQFLAHLIFQWLIAPWRFLENRDLSPTKAWYVVSRHASQLLAAIHRQDLQGLTVLLETITDHLLRFALKDSRRKSPSTLAQLQLLAA